MTDAKEPEVIEYLRQEARDGSEFLYNVRGGVACATSVILDEFDTLTRERDALTMHMNQVHATLGGTDTVLTLEAAQHVVFERDTLRTQLAAARELMAEAAMDIRYMVNAEYHGPNDVHPAMRAKYTRDMEIVTRLTAALSEATP